MDRTSKEAQLIGRSHEAKSRNFHGVDIDVLVAGSEAMVTKMKFKKGDQTPFHSHPNMTYSCRREKTSCDRASVNYAPRRHDLDRGTGAHNLRGCRIRVTGP